MDYQKLFNILPKIPIKWTVADIQVWLTFIGLQNLYPKFKELAIDGSILSSLTEEDLRQQLHIKSTITIKKIMSWLAKGLKQYEVYLMGSNASAINSVNDSKQITQKSKKIYKNLSVAEEVTHSSMTEEINRSSQNLGIFEEEVVKRKQYQLIIQQNDGPQTSFYSVKEQGAKIGRHSSNHILIFEDNISRFHAQIIFLNEKFYIRDSGSTTGTFIKINGRARIDQGTIFEMGSNQFQAHYHNNLLSLAIVEGPSISISPYKINNQISIGRNQTNNQIAFPDDQHLSNHHAKILLMDGKYYIEDLYTTNGTWRRLSKETQPSEQFQLLDNMVFKIGQSLSYICKIKTGYVVDKTNPNTCIICYQNDKDCVYMPCKHNTACIKCSKNLKECPICRIKIDEFIRIYK